MISTASDSVAPAVAPKPRAHAADAAVPRLRRETLLRDAIYRRSLALADVLALAIALDVSVVLVEGHRLRLLSLVLFPGLTLAAKTLGLYDHDRFVLRKSTLEDAPGLFQIASVLALTVWLSGSALATGASTRSQGLMVWLGFFVLALVGRAIGRAVLRRFSPVERCMLIADNEVQRKVANGLATGHGLELVTSLRQRDGESPSSPVPPHA